jgi:hypothetical protein
MASAATGGGVSAVVTGWGGTAITGGPAPNNLQVLTTTTLTNDDCRARHTTNNQRFVLDHKICTFTQAGQGICQGDSGGPLTANGQLIGTVSWNIPCARGFPDAFVSFKSESKFQLDTKKFSFRTAQLGSVPGSQNKLVSTNFHEIYIQKFKVNKAFFNNKSYLIN